ncbi:MAG: ABC transporter ATP-binding protein [Bacteroidales bacterium]|nr:ABC transporter ATP-binding protein [Bacteroidales bacterium]
MVEIHNLSKRYKGKSEPAVDQLSLKIAGKEIFGLLGPNGAGKTTTISILSGLLTPTSGQIKISGYDLQSNLQKIKHLIGVVAQDIALYEKLTAFENLYYFGSLYGIEKKELLNTIDDLLHRMGLLKNKNDKVKHLSGGMKRRLNLLAGLLHQPKLLYLDEPASGVDVQTRTVIHEFLLELKSKGTTIIYTSHFLDDAQRLCDRVSIIDYGKIISTGKPMELVNNNCDCNSLEEVFLKLTGRNIRD